MRYHCGSCTTELKDSGKLRSKSISILNIFFLKTKNLSCDSTSNYHSCLSLLVKASDKWQTHLCQVHARCFVSVRLCTTCPSSSTPKYTSVVKSSESEARLPGFDSWPHHLQCDLGQN